MANLYVKSGVATGWVALTAYTTERVVPTLASGFTTAKGRVFECTTAGTTGAAQPTWNTTVGGTTADGTVVWTTRDTTSWTNASPYLHYILNYKAAAGDTIYVSNNHAESIAQTENFTSPGTSANPVRIICASDTATPPTALATTATVTGTDATWLSFNGHAYSYGVSYTQSGALMRFGGNNASCWWKMESCTLNNASASGTGRISIGSLNGDNTVGQLVEWENVKVQFSSSGQGIYPNANFVWRNTASAISGATLPTTLFYSYATAMEALSLVDGVNISAITGNLVDVGSSIGTKFYFQNCKLNAGVTVTIGTSTGPGDSEVYMHNCDSGTTSYRLYEHKYAGTTQSETTLVRTGGASDGTTTISWKMVSGANNFFYRGLDSPWISQWQTTTGAAKTATIEILHDSVTALTDAEVYAEVEYYATTNPGTSFANDRAADILATPVAQTSSAVTWTTTGMANPNKQKLEVSFTPGMVGLVRVRVYLLKASYTIYVDPLVTIA